MQGGITLHDHIAPLAAIAPIRTTTRDKFFSAKAKTAVAAAAATHAYFGFVNKHDRFLSTRARQAGSTEKPSRRRQRARRVSKPDRKI
jgi:hypothetical protein